jgi:hypothetical protein
MKIAVRSLLMALMAMSLAQISAAQIQMGMSAPTISGVFNPVVGSGASYEMLKNGKKMTMDVAIVDKESGGYWMEVSSAFSPDDARAAHMNGTMYAKELLVRQGDDVVVQRIIVQMPGRPPMDMSSMPHAMQSKESKADMRANAENMGTETITTPAGTFLCQHWRSKKDNNDYWISDKVSPWQLVKMTDENKNTITLTKLITDAKSHITGTPVSMQEMMKGMGQ